MTTETEQRAAKRAAHAMRTAALRLALQRAGQESDPTLAYGCVDWFRYDTIGRTQDADTSALPGPPHPHTGRDDASVRH